MGSVCQIIDLDSTSTLHPSPNSAYNTTANSFHPVTLTCLRMGGVLSWVQIWGVIMTIEMIGEKTILVSLCDGDMRRYSLSLEGDNEKVQSGLKALLCRVGELCGLDHRGKSYLIEVLPSKKGCLLIISVHAVRRRRVFRVKRTQARQLCVFFDADAMLDFWRSQPRGGYAVYWYEGRYVLLPAVSATENKMARLSEYGELYPVSESVFARVREHGALLISSRHPMTASNEAI